MKKQNRFLSVLGAMLLLAAVLWAGCPIEASNVPVSPREGSQPVSWRDGEIKGDHFGHDRVVVVLSKEASLNFKTYTPEDFPEVKFSRVDDSTRLTMELVMKQLEAEKTGNWSGLKEYVDNNMLVKVENFRRIVDLILPEEERSAEKVKQAINSLKGRKDIEYAGPDYFIEMAAVPSPRPEHYDQQVVPLYSTYLPQAWDVITGPPVGSPPVKVAVMDTGIDADHPALTDRVDRAASRDYSDYILTGVINHNGYRGITDYKGHGTHVAGIIGANGTGVIGTIWNVTLVSLQLSGESHISMNSTVRYAVDYATSANIPIVNFSGYLHERSSDTNCYAAIKNYPGLFVTCAGNTPPNGNDNDKFPQYPASFDLDNMIVVGALNLDCTARASFSNWGKTSVDLFAPGTSIYSTYPVAKGSYIQDSGTSMAAPFVSGVAALLKTMNPNLSALEIKAIILNNAENVTALSTSCVTGGRLNALSAVQNSRLIGSFNIRYTNSMGVNGVIGDFYLFSNKAWAFIERGFTPPYPIPPDLATNPFAKYLGATAVPPEIRSYLAGINQSIYELVKVQVPSYDEKYGCQTREIEVYFTISGNGVKITNGYPSYTRVTGVVDQEKVKLLAKFGRLP